MYIMCNWSYPLRAAIEISKGSIQGLEIEDVDITALPMLNTDLEDGERFPPVVEAFRQKILEADSFLFASPEYNYSISGNTTTVTSPANLFSFYISWS